MTMAPLGLEGEERQTLFVECRSLADQLGLPDCSMGMSGDWTEAVAAGVRGCVWDLPCLANGMCQNLVRADLPGRG
jgi:hypothetical protein